MGVKLSDEGLKEGVGVVNVRFKAPVPDDTLDRSDGLVSRDGPSSELVDLILRSIS